MLGVFFQVPVVLRQPHTYVCINVRCDWSPRQLVCSQHRPPDVNSLEVTGNFHVVFFLNLDCFMTVLQVLFLHLVWTSLSGPLVFIPLFPVSVGDVPQSPVCAPSRPELRRFEAAVSGHCTQHLQQKSTPKTTQHRSPAACSCTFGDTMDTTRDKDDKQPDLKILTIL